MSRFTHRKAHAPRHEIQTFFEIVDTTKDEIVDMARNEARARLLVIRYNREAAANARD